MATITIGPFTAHISHQGKQRFINIPKDYHDDLVKTGFDSKLLTISIHLKKLT